MQDKKTKTIGVLTSGGDAPGMNAAVRAVVRTAIDKGINVKGVYRGYNGLIEGEVADIDSTGVADIISKGGTVLFSARSPLFRTQEGLMLAAENCKKFGLDGLIVIGGDGSFRGAKDLSELGIPCIGIPGTIDNDISCSEYTIGFDTAVNTAIECIDKIRDTSQSHDRCSIVEVMGRSAGYIALRAGIATGATAVLVPEVPYDFDRDIIERMKYAMRTGKHHFIIVVAEGVGGSAEMAAKIEDKLGIVTKCTVLGHVQRGGSPTAFDRVLASQLAYAAVELLEKGIGNRVVAVKDAKIVDYDIQEALKMKKNLDMKKYHMCYAISTAGHERFENFINGKK